MHTKQLLELFRAKSVGQGFTLTENLVALIILSITLAVMLPAFTNFGLQNAKNRQVSGAVALTNSIMSDLRRQRITELDADLGKTVLTLKPDPENDITYQVDQYICANEVSVNVANLAANCSTTTTADNPTRQILLEVKAPNDPNKTIYRVQTVFTNLRAPLRS